MYCWSPDESLFVVADAYGVTRVQFLRTPKVKTKPATSAGGITPWSSVSINHTGTSVLVYLNGFERTLRFSLPGLGPDQTYKRLELGNAWFCPDSDNLIFADSHHLSCYAPDRTTTPLPESGGGVRPTIGSGAPAWTDRALQISPDGALAHWSKSDLIYGKVSSNHFNKHFQVPVLAPPFSTCRAWPDAEGVTVTYHTPARLDGTPSQIGWVRLDTSGQVRDQQQHPGQSLPVAHYDRVGWLHNDQAVVVQGGTTLHFPVPGWGNLILGRARTLFLPELGEALLDLERATTLIRGLPAADVGFREQIASRLGPLVAANREAGIGAGLTGLTITPPPPLTSATRPTLFLSWNQTSPEQNRFGGVAARVADITIRHSLAREEIPVSGSLISGGCMFNSGTLSGPELEHLLSWAARHHIPVATLQRALPDIPEKERKSWNQIYLDPTAAALLRDAS